MLAQQGIEHVFKVVAGPQLLQRAPPARDRERHHAKQVVVWLAYPPAPAPDRAAGRPERRMPARRSPNPASARWVGSAGGSLGGW
jgi:hypothetical protein